MSKQLPLIIIIIEIQSRFPIFYGIMLFQPWGYKISNILEW